MTMPPPSSSRSSVGLNGQFLESGQLQAYRDDAALDRVWNRLESRRRRSFGPGPLIRGVAAAALVLGGVFLGMSIERNRSDSDLLAVVSSEVLVAQRAPASSVTDALLRTPNPIGQEKKAEKTKQTKREARQLHRRVQRRPHVAELAPVEEVEEQTAEEQLLVKPEEVATPSKPAWSVLADQGEFAAAFQQLDESGGFDGVLTNGNPEELMALADVARFVGRQGRAIQALKAVTERYQGDPNAPLAAMILGNLLSGAGDPAGAAEAYALNRRLSPGGDFAEDALVREFDMAVADSDLAGVERLRSQYEAEFPEGRHLSELRAEEERLVEALRATGVLDRKSGAEPDEPLHEAPTSAPSADSRASQDEAEKNEAE